MSSKDIINSIRNRSNKGMAAPIMNVKVSGGGSNAMLVKQQCELNKSIQEMLEKLSDCDQIRSCFESGNGITIDDGVISLQFSSFANEPSFVEAVQDAIGDNIESMIYDDENNQWNIVLVAQFDNTTNGVISVSGSGTADDPFVLDTGSEFCNEVVSCVEGATDLTLNNVTVNGDLDVNGSITPDSITIPDGTPLYTQDGESITSGSTHTTTNSITNTGLTINSTVNGVSNEVDLEPALATYLDDNTDTLVDNGDNTFTHTALDGTAVTFSTASDAEDVAYSNTDSGLTATNAQDALDETAANVAANTATLANHTSSISDIEGDVTSIQNSISTINSADDSVTDTVTGHKIATHTSKNGVSVDINETVTSLGDIVLTGNVISIPYTDEDGNTVSKTVDLTSSLEGAVAGIGRDDQVLSAAADSINDITLTPTTVTDSDGNEQVNYEMSSTLKPTYIVSGNPISDANKVVTEDTITALEAANGKSVTNLQNQITSNDDDIADIQTQQETNTTNIATNATDISNLQTGQATNTTNISNLQTAVTGNDADIEALQTQQGTNTSNISDLQNTVQTLQQGSQSTTTEINEVKENVTKIEKYNTDQSYISFDQGTVVQDVLLPHFTDESMADANRGHYIKSRAAFTGVKFIAASLYFSTPVSADTTLELYVNNNAIGTITVTASNKFAEITSFTNTDFTDGALITYKFTSVTDTDLEGQLILETLDQ